MHSTSADPNSPANWRIVWVLLPYLMEFPWRVALAMALLVGAKLANVAVPIALKHIIDSLDASQALVIVPLGLLVAYGALRFLSTFCGELRDAIFARVAERAMRRVTLQVFKHLHQLDLSFHLARKTGGLARDIERGTTGISFLLRFMLFNILPTLLEIALVAGILWAQFNWHYLLTVLAAVVVYAGFSIVVTEWRNRFIREANEQDNRSNTRAMDSLLNYETVKYFNAEHFELAEYDKQLADWENSRLKNRLSLFVLNSGQAFIIAATVCFMMTLAAYEVANKSMTLGDLVMVNAFMIQLFIPLNFLGFVYREIRQSLINIENLFKLLGEKSQLKDTQGAPDLSFKQGEIRFEQVSFSYDKTRPILQDVSFAINHGQKLALVGASGSGKSTLARLLFRFYDPDAGRILIDGQAIDAVNADSLRKHMGVVPQDTVLFNDSIFYNIHYANPAASAEDVKRAAAMANLSDFIARLPQGFDTLVGERGLKVSGGEKQRIAIARILLKNPPILIFDEATSALDSTTEQSILAALNSLALKHTTLVIAHRLSTVMDADKIVVLDQGRVVEQGTHPELIQLGGRYWQLWQHQQEEGGNLINNP
ncbi:MAG TPA: ABC transporter ATP-binding protein/permease [Cellvibrionaceae bacterium]|nr:ABC transporter ATP-binding protein/permease [Cellvibrionaceae bacterium]HMW70224.1 ABC transporter ATP-binding protein/permease [Cellvibrionaceae bacterium]HNG60175.1 ABC transporter ATP-binding protein/permease [Cellvibrionaceae bacterium]